MSRLRAVVVDDNKLNREMVVRILETNGIQTVQADDAMQGHKVIKMVSPHLVILDIMMPGDLDGVDLCRMIRNDPESEDMIVVMITAADKRKETDRSMDAGADILIPKPFSPAEFWMQIDSLLKDRKAKLPNFKILVIDDREEDAELAQRVLSKAGYEVTVHVSAQGVIKTVRGFAPDMILLDVMMPTLSGKDLFRIIQTDKSILKKPKIVFYSNKTAQELRILVEQTGAAGFICKTHGPTGLVSNVRSIFDVL